MNSLRNFTNGRFTNAEPTRVMKPGMNPGLIYRFLFKGHKDRTPSRPLPVVGMQGLARQPATDGLRFAWLGHSSVLVELDGKRVLIDPMFSERLVHFLGGAETLPARAGPGGRPARAQRRADIP